MKGRKTHLVRRFPDGDTPVERMERLASELVYLADEVDSLATALKEEEDARRAAWLNAHPTS